MADNDDKNETESAAQVEATKEKKSKSKTKKRRMSASEYQKWIVMEQGTMEVDSQGNPHLAEQQQHDPAMLIRIPSWMFISESDATSTESGQSDKESSSPHYVNMDQQQQHHLEEQYTHKAIRWQHWKAEFCDLFHELVHYGKNKSLKKKILTVVVCASSLLVFADLIFFGNIVIWLQNFILWMGNNIGAGIFAFIGLFVVTTRT